MSLLSGERIVSDIHSYFVSRDQLLPMKSMLSHHGVSAVWHFTDRSNIELIRKNQGLLSLAELKRRGIAVPRPGGNEWSHNADEMNGVNGYVHLAFLNDHPMLFVAKQDSRIVDPVWLKVDASILLEEGVRFTNDVANKSGVELLASNVACEKIDFDVLFTHTNWNDPEIMARRKRALKSEILVPNIVPIGKILNLNEYG